MPVLGTRVRCLVVWATVSVAALLAGRVLGPGAAHLLARAGTRPGPVVGPTYDELLVGLCTAALLACLAWGWLVTTVVVVEAWRGVDVDRADPGVSGPAGVPIWARRLVLAACGAALVATASPAGATTAPRSEGPVAVGPAPRAADLDLDGLPYPDRPSGADRPAVPRPPVAGRRGNPSPVAGSYVVRPGDSLWAITERRLASRAPGAGAATGAADVAEVASAARATYDRNRAVVGDDPDLILPGQQLRLPPP